MKTDCQNIVLLSIGLILVFSEKSYSGDDYNIFEEAFNHLDGSVDANIDTSSKATKYPLSSDDSEADIYRDDDGRVYIGNNRKIYLHFSLSKDENAPVYPLQKLGLSKGSSKTMELTSEGLYRFISIKSTFTKGSFYRGFNSSPHFGLIVDGSGPKVFITPLAKSRFTSRGKHYFSAPLTVDFKGIDDKSGLKSIFFSLNESGYVPYNAEVEIRKEGENTIRAYGIDNIGNKGKSYTKKFVVDTSPPVTSVDIVGLSQKSVLSRSSKFILASRDASSGVKKTMYYITGDSGYKGNARTYRGRPISLKGLKPGNYKLNYFSVDNVYNYENVSYFDFYIDVAPPKSVITLLGDNFRKRNITYISSRTLFEINAEDDASGVDHISYNFGTNRNYIYKNPVKPIYKSGWQSLYITSRDQVGNRSILSKYSYFMDVSKPSTTSKIVGPIYRKGKSLYGTMDTKMELYSYDKQSGVSNIYYSFANGPVHKYSGPFSLQGEGKTRIYFYGQDNVNNQESRKYRDIFIDNQPPKIIEKTGSALIAKRTINGEDISVYPKNTFIFINAMDGGSGVGTVSYKVNNGKRKPLKKAGVLLNRYGLHRFEVIAVDRLGNLGKKNFSIFIGENRLFAH